MNAENKPGSTQRSDRRFLLVPAATFLVGLLLGGARVWVAQPGGDDGGTAGEQPTASPTATGSPQPGASPADPEAVRISQACLRAAEASANVVNLVRDAATALSELDAGRLRELVDRMEVLDTQIRDDVAVCRQESDL